MPASVPSSSAMYRAAARAGGHSISMPNAIDSSATQDITLGRLSGWAQDISDRLSASGLDLNYGLVSFVDDIVADKTTCGDPTYGAAWMASANISLIGPHHIVDLDR